MKTYITIDGGTTNIRISIVRERTILAQKKISAGSVAWIEQKASLCAQMKAAISELLDAYKLGEQDIERVLASGMITSEVGLCHLEHLCAPVGLADLHEGMQVLTSWG